MLSTASTHLHHGRGPRRAPHEAGRWPGGGHQGQVQAQAAAACPAGHTQHLARLRHKMAPPGPLHAPAPAAWGAGGHRAGLSIFETHRSASAQLPQ